MITIGSIETPEKANLLCKVTYKVNKPIFMIAVKTEKQARYIDLINYGYINTMYFSQLDFQFWYCNKLSKEEFLKELERLFSVGFIKDEDGLKSIAHYLI